MWGPFLGSWKWVESRRVTMHASSSDMCGGLPFRFIFKNNPWHMGIVFFAGNITIAGVRIEKCIEKCL